MTASTKNKLGRNPFDRKSATPEQRRAAAEERAAAAAYAELAVPCLSDIARAIYWTAVGLSAQVVAVTLRSVLASPIGRLAK